MKRYYVVLLALVAALLVQGMMPQFAGDGRYTVEAALSGGSGRAGITSPVELVVNGDTITATVEWSSPFFEHMLVGGALYYPTRTEGNSTFVIPVVLDEDMTVSAQTIAMSQPHVVDYTLHLDSATMKPVAEAGRILAIILIGAAVCVAAFAVVDVRRTARKDRGTS